MKPTGFIDIPSFEKLYAINKNGTVWSYPKAWKAANGSHRSHEGRYLKPFRIGKKNKQYLAVELAKGKSQNYTVHRLVATTFLANPQNHPIINHKDGNRFNNNSSNLEWCTQKHNMSEAQRLGLNKQFYGEDHAGHKLTTQEVKDIRNKRNLGRTLRELASEYDSSISNISYIVQGRTRIYG